MGFIIRSDDTTSLNEIRQFVSANVTDAVLPDSLIDSPIFLRAAEFRVYKLFQESGVMSAQTDDAYLTAIGYDTANEKSLYRFLDSFPLAFNFKGLWVSGTDYVRGDIVEYPLITVTTGVRPTPQPLYYAIEPRSTTDTTTPNLDSNWVSIPVNFVGDFNPSVNYNQYDIIIDHDPITNVRDLYYAKMAVSAGSFNVSEWQQITSPLSLPVLSLLLTRSLTANLTQTDAQKSIEERAKIVTQYYTAILLIMSLPQLVEEQILRERVRYQEIDWEKRIELYEDIIIIIIDPIIPDDHIFASGTAVFGCVEQRVAF